MRIHFNKFARQKPLIEVLKDEPCDWTVQLDTPQEDLLEKFDRGEIEDA